MKTIKIFAAAAGLFIGLSVNAQEHSAKPADVKQDNKKEAKPHKSLAGTKPVKFNEKNRADQDKEKAEKEKAAANQKEEVKKDGDKPKAAISDDKKTEGKGDNNTRMKEIKRPVKKSTSESLPK